MIDERTRRKSEFDERDIAWIALADGSRWAFPKPWLEVRASFHGGRAASSCSLLTYGRELDELVRAIGECRDDAALLIASASLGAYLLGHHYELSDDDLDRLFAIRVGDPDSWEWARSVIEVATGASGCRSFRDGSG